MASEMLLGPLRVIQVEHRIERLHFAALVGLATDDGDWERDDPQETHRIADDFQLCVEAEAVVVTGQIMERRHRA
ncbi:hypothetical protein GCM10025867_39730 [Frondihabitans sucicola]|uniref:Uncharacterized protein n=1 Tax=Frondihabitans sucicola TaxID=1268041 RepID=A0ABM8GTG2_9MICO|nr:hypothetical protein [Frondihabitans sucicola]BDZ51732.1 hypothetical protein GCM10025867_39730 [Frondihabitans sucicola]